MDLEKFNLRVEWDFLYTYISSDYPYELKSAEIQTLGRNFLNLEEVKAYIKEELSKRKVRNIKVFKLEQICEGEL